MFTGETRIAGLEIRHQFSRTRMDVVQSGVGDGDVARRTAGTLAIQLRQHIGGTADTSVVLPHTSAELHASVPR